MKLKSVLLSLLFLFCFAAPAFSSHIVGVDFTYRCLGPGANGTFLYEINLDLYQDCLTGSPQAISEDNPAYLAFYNASTNSRYLVDSVYSNSFQIVPPNFSNQCVNNPPSTCLRRERFSKVYALPANANGYRCVYQRCCRNGSILNIFNPGAVGATYFCLIPPASVGCNNSAVFKNYPPQIICVNNPLVYDHSATDADGDSLSYEFCQAYEGGSTTDAKPYPPPPPPYVPVSYVGGFSALNPISGSPAIQISPTTGLITGTPNTLGRFVVAVCCNEWRNGVIINTIKREFQFVVTNCSKAVVADIPQYSDEFNTYRVECKSMTVQFDNISTGGDTYFWDFGVPGVQNDTSTQFSPTFTYPDTGTYTVKLIVNKGSTCPDSISKLVKIYPLFHAAFTFNGAPCPKTPFQFTDSSYGSYGKPINWLWTFGDEASAMIQNPVHSYDTGGLFQVVLISKNAKGCTDTAAKQVFVEKFKPFGGNDTIIVKGEIINFYSSGGGQYTWTPSTYLSNPNIGNPVGSYPDTGSFTYIVHISSPSGCVGNDTFTVRVVSQAALFVPTAFSPNGDGLNDVLKPIGIGYRDLRYFKVFNRWGEMVYNTNQFNQGWDGTLRGAKADMGTYFWVLSIIDRFGKEEMIKGDSQLVR